MTYTPGLLKDIKVHNLMEIRADEGEETCDIPSGLYIALAIIDTPSGPLIEVSMVGGGGSRGVNITKRNAHLVKRVIDTTAAPDMLAALLAFERATQLNNVCNDDPSASLEWMDASDDAVSRCAAVLKRLRDAGVIAHE